MDYEIWKPIPGFFLYEASNTGRIRKSAFLRSDGRRWPSKIISQCWKGKYLVVNIFLGNTHKTISVARLVLMAHVRLPAKEELARHLDDNPSNNKLENLAWGTVQDNADDAIRNNRIKRGDAVNTSRLTKKDVLYIRQRGKIVPYCKDSKNKDLARRFGVSVISIYNIIKRKTWTHV